MPPGAPPPECPPECRSECPNPNPITLTLTRFEQGVPLPVPGHEKEITFKGWLFSFVGDAPAVGEMVGTKQSFSLAKNPCNMCENAHQFAAGGREYSAFLGCNCADDRQHDYWCEGNLALC